MNNMLNMLIIIGLIALSGAVQGANSSGKAVANGKPFAIINDEVVELRSMVDDIEVRVGELESGFTTLSGDVEDLTYTLGAYETYVETRLTELVEAISKLQAKDTELYNQIETNVAKLSEQNQDIVALFTQYTELSSQLALLQSQALTHATIGDIQTLNSQIAGLVGDMSELDDGLAGALYEIGVNAGAIQALEEQQQEFALFIENLQDTCGEDEFIREVQEDGSTVCYPQSAVGNIGVSRVRVFSFTTTIPRLKTIQLAARCPESHPIVSGAGHNHYPNPDAIVFSSIPSLYSSNSDNVVRYFDGWSIGIANYGNAPVFNVFISMLCSVGEATQTSMNTPLL